VVNGCSRPGGDCTGKETIADELYPIVENILDELDRWLTVRGP
jgi:hypothetical protein